MIFSIWDPSNGQAITTVYQEPGSRSNPFGGEGTGLHWDNTPMGHTWNLDTTYTFVCRTWPGATDHTQFGLWTRDESTGVWTHHVTMDFPIGGQSFRYGLNSFLELWAGYDPAFRYVGFSNTWSRRPVGGWTQLRSMWTDGGLANGPQGTLDQGGLAGAAAYLRSGQGYASNTTTSLLADPQPRPVYEPAAVLAGGGVDSPVRGLFDVTWTLDPRRSPQHSYRLEIYSTPDATGDPILTRAETAPHVHSLSFSRAQLPPGLYSARVWITDLFDQPSRPFSFVFRRPVSNVTFLSDLPWSSSSNGWGPAERDRSNGETGAADGHAITLGGATYAKGIGCHAASVITADLGRAYDRFAADLGVDDEVGGNGSVTFEVRRDGQRLFLSDVLRGDSATKSIDLDVRGASQLQLRAADAGDGNGSDHADWAGAALVSYPCASVGVKVDVSDRVQGVVSEPISLSVRATGDSPVYRWRRNGEPIPDALNATAGTATLVIDRPTLDDEGSYDCFISNACSSTSSRVCVVVVCVGDFDSNGGVDGSDVEAFFHAWERALPIADVNGDGGVDGADIESFFKRWTAGC
jgi:hypothetical protein